MVTERFLLGRGRETIDPADLAALEAAMSDVQVLPSRAVMVRRGEVVRAATMLVSGYAVRYMDDREGGRQLVAVHVPGDFIDLHGFPMRKLDHDIATIGPATIAQVEHAQLLEFSETRADLTRKFWFSTLLDAAMHREWIFRLGRLSAEGRVAHLFCEIETRLATVGLCDDGRFALPFTQADIGETCGLTGVHVNRTLRRLREQGLMTFAHGQAAVLDRAGLHAAAEFDDAYLYTDRAWGPRDERA